MRRRWGVSDRRTPDATLISALRILARDIQSGDGCANACLLEAAQRLAELVEERRWVPVGERLPGDTVECLVFHKRSKEVRTAYVYKGDWWDGPYLITGNVTHWMPLPPGPDGDGNG